MQGFAFGTFVSWQPAFSYGEDKVKAAVKVGMGSCPPCTAAHFEVQNLICNYGLVDFSIAAHFAGPELGSIQCGWNDAWTHSSCYVVS